MKREEILQKAESLVNGPRAKDYGDAYENHERIAKMWSVLLDKDISVSQISKHCLLYTSPSPRDRTRSRMPSSA